MMRACAVALALLATAATPTLASRGHHPRRGADTCDRNPGIFHFRLGKANLVALSDGFNPIPIDLNFVDDEAVVRRVVQYTDYRDSIDPFKMEANLLYMDYKGKKVLLDAGGGPFVETQGLLPKQLRAIGVRPEEIDHILITHAHFDHLGGLLIDKDSDELQFPKARVHIARAEYDFWFQKDLVLTSATPPDVQKAIIGTAVDVLSKVPKKQLQFFDEGDTIVPGITAAHFTTWHTPGHTIFRVRPEGAPKPLMFTGDAFPAAGMGLEAPWLRSGFDEQAEDGPAGKYAMLDRFVKEDVWFHGYHTGFPAIFALAPDGISYRGVRAPWEPEVGVGLTCDA